MQIDLSVLLSGGTLVAVLGFFIRNESRMTRIETILDIKIKDSEK